MRLGLFLFAALLVWVSALTPLVSAQGVTVVTGKVTSDGNPIGAGTVVQVMLQDGTVIGVGFTGNQGFDSNQYRIDIQSTPSLQGQVIFARAVVGGIAKPEANPSGAVFTAGQVLTINVPFMSVPGSARPADALAEVIATGFLEIVTSFNYATLVYESFVPNLPGDSLAFIRPNSVLMITTTQNLAIVVGTNPFTVWANMPTPVPVGATVYITLA